MLGSLAMVSILQFQGRVDAARRAQVVIAEMRNEQLALVGIAFSRVTEGARGSDSTGVRLSRADAVLAASSATLPRLGRSDAPRAINALLRRYEPFVVHLARLVASGHSTQAALGYGASQRPGGLDFKLAAEFTNADNSYDAEAARSQMVAAVGTVSSIAFLLAAFAIAFYYSVRARRRSHLEATTDALTGLGNRRKLFADLDRVVATAPADGLSIGMFDLDKFKSYNDTFGHPAGDALLARLGARLAAAVGDDGFAYRIGGDEFVVVATNDKLSVLADAQAALSEQGEGFSIGCSFGTTEMHAGIGAEEALHLADERLYANKRIAHGGQATNLHSETKDVLLQVLAEQDSSLSVHLDHVAQLAADTARILELPDEQVERIRLAAELHDVGKAAIPDSILNKPGPLTHAEQAFIERHSEIGARIIAAAPSLERIAPIVRSTHERIDGAGYPDGLTGDEIPICSRIIAVVDAYDAMTSDRPYRPATSASMALNELRRHAGGQFDRVVVEAFAIALARHATTSAKAA
jgi:two-component system cell cycle response regulator